MYERKISKIGRKDKKMEYLERKRVYGRKNKIFSKIYQFFI
jgi:hypothetical protein